MVMYAAVYGTGSVALNIYTELIEEFGEDYVAFFIESMLDKDEFCGKPVYTLEYLANNIDINEYQYYLGSISSQHSMMRELLQIGVLESNINKRLDYSEDNFERSIKFIKNLLFYPKVTYREKLKLECILNLYLGELKKKLNIDFEMKKEASQYDLILVWKKEFLRDKQLEKNCKVFCIDDSFYPTIMSRIFVRLTNTLFPKDRKKLYRVKTINNIKKLISMNIEQSYIFGGGPTLEQGIESYLKNKSINSITMVCNGFINSGDSIMEKVSPQIYLLFDILYLQGDLKETLDKASKYICEHDCLLVVPDFWIPVLLNRYLGLEEKMIGLNIGSDSIHFPDTTDLSVYNKAGNVITALGIPLASTVSNEIYFIGCDGKKNEKSENKKSVGWEYSKLAYENINLDISNRDVYDYEEKHYAYFQQLIAYGEMNNKYYESITPSYIPCLKERYKPK